MPYDILDRGINAKLLFDAALYNYSLVIEDSVSGFQLHFHLYGESGNNNMMNVHVVPPGLKPTDGGVDQFIHELSRDDLVLIRNFFGTIDIGTLQQWTS